MKRFTLEVSGDFACFTRPEMKVERVSYEIITPSAARAVFESILFKKANTRNGLRWHIRRIEVLNPIRWINLRRNEVGLRISSRNITNAMNNSTPIALFIEKERQQRAGLFLMDVKYRLHADLEVLEKSEHPLKYIEMFERRASHGQCINQPYLGCREFSADFRLVNPDNEPTQIPDELRGSKPLGWMLYDLDYSDPDNPRPRFFNARLEQGILDVPDWNSAEIHE
ncbi:CRISPR pre-crRNA endoribonuclease Cas5d [Gammaproteobacteria bacterium]